MAKQTSSKVLRRTQPGIPARNATSRGPMLAIVIALCAVIATIVGFVVRPIAEKAFVLWYARNATGLQIDANAVDRSDGGYALLGVSATTPGGAASITADRAIVTLDGHDARIVLDAPHVVFASDRFRGDELSGLRAAMDRSGFGSAQLAISMRNGNATLTRSDLPGPVLAFDTISGSSTVSPQSVRYDLAANLQSGGRTYPLTVHSEAAPSGAVANHLSAALLPLEPLANLFPATNDIRVMGGQLHDVDLTDDTALHATAHLSAGAFSFGTHALAGLHGPIVFADNGAGSTGLVGTIDRVPLSMSGEVHDLGAHFGFLQQGSNDVSSLAALTEKMASEPRVRSIVVEADAPGLVFGQYAITTDHGPLAISILAADPREPTLRFDTAIAEDRVISGGERTSAMGVRTGAVGGVNGDYFDIGRTYQPQGMLVRSGEMVRGPVERAALAIDKDKHVTFGEFQFVGLVRAGNRTYPITQFNDWPVGAATIITPAFGKELPPDPGTLFARLAPVTGSKTLYTVTAVESAIDPLPVGFGVAFGSKLNAVMHVGEQISVAYKTVPPIGDAVAAIGGGPILVRDGEAFEDPHAPAPDERNFRWPVIGLAQTNDGRLMLVAVDGRHPERSIGMMRPEFSDLLLRLGTRNAMALDSGGSVTLVSRKPGDANVSVRNVPSDNSAERWVSDALYLYSSAPLPTIVPVAGAPTPVPEVRPSP